MNCSVAFFEWLHIGVSSSDLKVQCTLYIIIDMIACQNIAQWLFEWSRASKGCIHIYFSKLVQLTFRRFKEVSAVHKEVSRLVRIHPTAVAQLPEALQVTRSSQQDIEIIPWKVRTNDFYSQVTMHLKKKKWLRTATEWVFFYASQRLNKNRLSTFHDMMFLFHMFLEMTDKFQRMEVNDCENTSFVQSETRTKVLHNVNL